MTDIFGLSKFWECGEITDTGSARVKTRAICGLTFQFQKQSVRDRSLMGLSLGGHIDRFADIFQEAIKARLLLGDDASVQETREHFMPVFVKFLPVMLKRLAEPEFYDFINDLCKTVRYFDGKNFQPLNLENHYEACFEDDLTMQIPVALSVLEVNLSDGFFDKLVSVFNSETSPTEESENTSTNLVEGLLTKT